MSRTIPTLALSIFLLSATCLAEQRTVVYVNHSPDKRYSANEIDSRIVFLLPDGNYAFGHDYGRTTACDTDVMDCVEFDFMAVSGVSINQEIGDEFSVGKRRFVLNSEVIVEVLGVKEKTIKIDVFREEEHTNSYLFSRCRGVVAIVVLNHGNEHIPRSMFYSADSSGLFQNEDASCVK